MRSALAGAGEVGAGFGAYLAAAGHDIVALVRDGNWRQSGRAGLRRQPTSLHLLARLRQEGNERRAIRQRLAAPAGVTHYIHDIFGNVIAETAGDGATGATGTVREYI